MVLELYTKQSEVSMTQREKAYENLMGKSKKSWSSFSHTGFYAATDKFLHNGQVKSKCFQFGQVQKFIIWFVECLLLLAACNDQDKRKFCNE